MKAKEKYDLYIGLFPKQDFTTVVKDLFGEKNAIVFTFPTASNPISEEEVFMLRSLHVVNVFQIVEEAIVFLLSHGRRKREKVDYDDVDYRFQIYGRVQYLFVDDHSDRESLPIPDPVDTLSLAPA